MLESRVVKAVLRLVALFSLIMLLKHWVSPTRLIDTFGTTVTDGGAPIVEKGAMDGLAVVETSHGFAGFYCITGFSARGSYFSLTVPSLLLVALVLLPLGHWLMMSKHDTDDRRK